MSNPGISITRIQYNGYNLSQQQRCQHPYNRGKGTKIKSFCNAESSKN